VLTFIPVAPAATQDSDLLDSSKAGKSKPRADDSQASKNAAALNAADAAKKRAEALIAEAMSQACTSNGQICDICRDACTQPPSLLLRR